MISNVKSRIRQSELPSWWTWSCYEGLIRSAFVNSQTRLLVTVFQQKVWTLELRILISCDIWGLWYQSDGRYHATVGNVLQAQCKFVACTAWLLFTNKPNSDLYHDRDQYRRKSGAGWWYSGTEYVIGCTAQENVGHGWVVSFKDNQFTCLVSPGRENSLITRGTTDEAAIGMWTMLLEARWYRRVRRLIEIGQRSSRYRFYLENKLDDISGRFIA